MNKIVQIGDSVICRCKLPVAYNITATLKTQAAVDEVNMDLMSDEPIWELLGVLYPDQSEIAFSGINHE